MAAAATADSAILRLRETSPTLAVSAVARRTVDEVSSRGAIPGVQSLAEIVQAVPHGFSTGTAGRPRSGSSDLTSGASGVIHAAGLQGLALGIRLVIGLLLLAAGAVKVADRRGFRDALRGYELLPDPLNAVAVVVVPALELALGSALLLGIYVHESGLAAAALLAAFTAWLVIALSRGKTVDCGCFSRSTPTRLSWRLVCRNLLLIFAALFVAETLPIASLDQYVIESGSHAYSYSAVIPGLMLTSVAVSLVVIAASSDRLIRKERV
jgi:uncharacterized membrane protein YphA (DoxX/SURF4 family)